MWWKSAEQELIHAYLQSDHRRILAESVDRTEDELEFHPEQVGEDYHEGIRRVVVDKWLMYLTVSDLDRLVEVVRFRRRV